MKFEFSNGVKTVNSGRSSDYFSTAVSVSINDWRDKPENHALVLQGYNDKGRLMKGDLEIPVADMPAFIQELQDMYNGYKATQSNG